MEVGIMARKNSNGRINRRNLLASGAAGAVALSGCSGDSGDGGDGGSGGDTGDGGDGGDTGGDTGGATPTEQGPPEEVEPYLQEIPDYYPDDYWRIIDGAMDESDQLIYTAMFGAWIENMVAGFNEKFDFIDWNITTLGTAETYSRFTTEASRGQINPDVIYSNDPIALRQLHVADLLEDYVSPNISETDAFPDRAQSDIDALVQLHHTWGTHVWNPSIYEEAGVETPPVNHDIDWTTDHIEDNPDFYRGNTAMYDGITSTSAWQQMDLYARENGEDWMSQQYEELATSNPQSFWSTSTMGGWVANGEVAYGMGLAQWIIARYVAPDFTLGEDVTWGQHIMHNVMHPSYQVVSEADNPNSARLWTDWILSKHGQAWLCSNWFTGPIRNDIPNSELSEDPIWGVTTGLSSIQEADNMTMLGDALLMDFDERTVSSDAKSKYKDQWYNTFN
jgi:ABC-type Fe3+ transport system substrate-binding protein